MYKSLARSFFFGNFFYGACVVALAMEASLQQGLPLNPFFFYLLLYCGTVLYYLKAYAGAPVSDVTDKRARWYFHNRKAVRGIQLALLLLCLLSAIVLFHACWQNFFLLNIWDYVLLVIFPMMAVLYYGLSFPGIPQVTLREAGWLKPFVIGFVWAGAVTIYPVIFRQLQSGLHYNYSWINGWFFLKNWMFITVLCIMFDIKDYAADHNRHLKTFVVRMGLRKTIFRIIIPLVITGLGAFVLFAIVRHLSWVIVMINSIPFILLIAVAYSLHERRPILYYLAIIDGQMLVKAICGITAILFLK